jgi:hypothetical protein
MKKIKQFSQEVDDKSMKMKNKGWREVNLPIPEHLLDV